MTDHSAIWTSEALAELRDVAYDHGEAYLSALERGHYQRALSMAKAAVTSVSILVEEQQRKGKK